MQNVKGLKSESEGRPVCLHGSSRKGLGDWAEQHRTKENQERSCHGSEGEIEAKGEPKPLNTTSVKEKEKVTGDLGKTVSLLCWLGNKFQWVGKEWELKKSTQHWRLVSPEPWLKRGDMIVTGGPRAKREIVTCFFKTTLLCL